MRIQESMWKQIRNSGSYFGLNCTLPLQETPRGVARISDLLTDGYAVVFSTPGCKSFRITLHNEPKWTNEIPKSNEMSLGSNRMQIRDVKVTGHFHDGFHEKNWAAVSRQEARLSSDHHRAGHLTVLHRLDTRQESSGRLGHRPRAITLWFLAFVRHEDWPRLRCEPH